MTDSALPHQIDGANFLVQNRTALLADDMGCGKTHSAVRGLDQCGARRVLILCPTVVKSNWYNEIRRWSRYDREIDIVDGLPKQPLSKTGVTILGHASLVIPSSSSGTKQAKHNRALASQIGRAHV